jgi:cell division protein FtsN
VAPVAVVEKTDKPAVEEQAAKTVPAPSVKPPFRDENQAASATPPFKSDKKAVEEKKETKKAPKEGAYIYAAQTGVFENEKNADALAAKLKKTGLNAYVQKDSGVIVIKKKKDELTSENMVMYRVLVGKFDNNKKAVEQVRFLKEAGIDAVPYRY